MEFDLISEAELRNLPTDNDEAFVEAALADELGVPNLGYPDLADYDHKVYLAYPEFSRRALAEAAKIIARNRHDKDATLICATTTVSVSARLWRS
jgi:hypothetical protein